MMNPPDSELMSYLVRMVIPVKREFGRTLNVQLFLRDEPYAKEVIAEALHSKDERLQNYAAYVQTKLFGPRTSQAPAASAAPATGQAAPAATRSDDMKAAVLAKYKTGLR